MYISTRETQTTGPYLRARSIQLRAVARHIIDRSQEMDTPLTVDALIECVDGMCVPVALADAKDRGSESWIGDVSVLMNGSNSVEVVAIRIRMRNGDVADMGIIARRTDEPQMLGAMVFDQEILSTVDSWDGERLELIAGRQ